ncbi:MAG TPA: 5-(carboxyamino)imidazole ribonucleotide synthase [Longimicrobiales bacterium]|nr:5-(carboxyamino)imidazole ribonucleotide synthase [Longimicrobiales bacterium]
MRVGVLGGGQLGRMLALAGRPLGLRFRFLEPSTPAPVDELGAVVRAAYDDTDALDRFADGLDVVTYEFENVPVRSARRLAERVPVRPSPAALEVGQDRVAEKDAFTEAGIPTAPFRGVASLEELEAAVRAGGLPAVLKTRRFGYDGKGQAVVRTEDDIGRTWDRLGRVPLLVEAFVPFERELSIVAVRGLDRDCRFYPLVENVHREGILWRTTAPAPRVPAALQAEAEEYARHLLELFDYVGVLAIELFEEGGRLLANELAPRVHNSAHWTQDGAWTSQFENHLRAVCGLPLGPTDVRAPTVMLNLLGRIPDPAEVLRIPGARLHLYDKAPRPGRKVGHVNLVGDDGEDPGGRLARLERLAEG